MEEGLILISQLNDYVFCPASIYFHNLYGDEDNRLFQRTDQVKGSQAHTSIDTGTYSTRSDVLTGMDVYSERYGLIGKIDIYDGRENSLIERKKRIKTIYDGYVFQLYAQYYCMCEMGYDVKKLFLYSMDNNKKYPVDMPEDNPEMKLKFEDTIKSISKFNIGLYEQTNLDKCKGCIYEPICDRSLL